MAIRKEETAFRRGGCARQSDAVAANGLDDDVDVRLVRHLDRVVIPRRAANVEPFRLDDVGDCGELHGPAAAAGGDESRVGLEDVAYSASNGSQAGHGDT